MSTDLLFDAPWWVLVAAAIVGAALLISGNRRQRRDMMGVGAAVLLLTAGWFALSYFVDTDLEKNIKRTRAIAQAVDDKDWAKLRSLLDANTRFAFYSNRDQLVAGGQATAERIGLKNVRITSMEARQDGTLITIDLNALSEQDIGPTLPTSWRFNYNNLGTGWQLTSIEPLPTRALTPDVIREHLTRP
jgi:hypothetical protein